MTDTLRHQCRKCRAKLSAPVENLRHAFCTRGCFGSHYRSRCRVCEGSIRRKSEQQKTCTDRRCKNELRRYPRAYSWPVEHNLDNHPSDVSRAQETPGFVGSKGPVLPRHRCLREWWWGGDDVGDYSLYDKDGLTIACIVLAAGRYWLRTPIAIGPGWPYERVSWPSLEQAKRGAEAAALGSLPLDPATTARIKRDNATPHPMGPPLNRPVPPLDPAERAVGLEIAFTASGPRSVDLEIPDFLRRDLDAPNHRGAP
jgi:hypothetical protein